MEIYLHDSEKREGFYFSSKDSCFHIFDKIMYRKLNLPEFYLSDLRNILDKRRDCIPVGNEIIFLNISDQELCQSPLHKKVVKRDSSYFFTWSLPFLDFPSFPKITGSVFIETLKEFCMSPVNKILELNISQKLAERLTFLLEVIKPIFCRLPDNFIYKQDISVSKYHEYQKVWFGIIFNYTHHTIRRTKIGKLGPEIDFSLIICSDKGLKVSESDVENLNINISDLVYNLLPLNL